MLLSLSKLLAYTVVFLLNQLQYFSMFWCSQGKLWRGNKWNFPVFIWDCVIQAGMTRFLVAAHIQVQYVEMRFVLKHHNKAFKKIQHFQLTTELDLNACLKAYTKLEQKYMKASASIWGNMIIFSIYFCHLSLISFFRLVCFHSFADQNGQICRSNHITVNSFWSLC